MFRNRIGDPARRRVAFFEADICHNGDHTIELRLKSQNGVERSGRSCVPEVILFHEPATRIIDITGRGRVQRPASGGADDRRSVPQATQVNLAEGGQIGG